MAILCGADRRHRGNRLAAAQGVAASQRAVELAITKMLLAAGADPNASEPFQGCCAA